MKDTFGKRLQIALDRKNIKQVELAERLECSKSRVSQWINNKHIPNSQILHRVAEELKVSEVWLLGESDEMTYDREELEMKYEVCDLFQKCYGKEAYKAVYDFLQLDESDKNTIISNIQFLLSSDKYTKKKESLNA